MALLRLAQHYAGQAGRRAVRLQVQGIAKRPLGLRRAGTQLQRQPME